MYYFVKSRKGDMFYKGDFIYLYTVDFASELEKSEYAVTPLKLNEMPKIN